MGHTLQERMNIMLERMDKHYGPNRIKKDVQGRYR